MKRTSRIATVLALGLALVAVSWRGHVTPARADEAADPDLDGVPGISAPPAIPQAAAPSVLVAPGRMLIDRSHNEAFDVSGFTSFLVLQGWVVNENLGPIAAIALAGYDVLMIPTRSVFTAMTPFSPSEIAAIQTFVQSGKGLWVFHDDLDATAVNTLAQVFGVTFHYDFIRDPTNNEGDQAWPTIHILSSHPVTAGIESYGYYGGDCLSVASPATIIGRADEDAFSLYCAAGSRPPTLAVWAETGRAVFAGDITPLHPTYYPSRLRPEEQLLLQNIVNWLRGATPTATSPTSWGRVKSIYSSSTLPGAGIRPSQSP